MRTQFKPLNHHMFTLLGVNCGHIVIDGRERASDLIYSRRFGRRQIRKLFKAGRISQDDIHIITQQMEEGVLENETDFFAQIGLWQPPHGYIAEFNFSMCGCSFPLPHGYICHLQSNSIYQEPIDTLFEGFSVICQAVDSGMMHSYQGANLLSQMVHAKLPRNNYEVRQLAESLPPEQRILVEEVEAEASLQAFEDGIRAMLPTAPILVIEF